jgi:5-methylcytosine-specific restriction endonuclease McrA
MARKRKSSPSVSNISDVILGKDFKSPFETSTFGIKEKPIRKKIPKAVREQVWDVYIGTAKMEGKCYCCGWRTITFREFEVGHNKAVAKGGKDNISNLRPICRKCNSSTGTMSIEQYKKKYFTKPKTSKKKTKRKAKKKKTTSPFDVTLPKTKYPLF